MYTLIPSLLDLPLTPHPTLLGHHRDELSALCSNLPLTMYFLHGRVYMSALLSWFIPLSSSHPVPTYPFSEPLSLPCK